MDQFGQEEAEEKTLPRWVTIPLGIVLAPFTLLCVIGSASLLLAPRVPPSILTVSLGTIFFAGSTGARNFLGKASAAQRHDRCIHCCRATLAWHGQRTIRKCLTTRYRVDGPKLKR